MNVLDHFKTAMITIGLLAATLVWAPFANAAPDANSGNTDKSDLNKDHVVDNDDLVIFSSTYLELDWESVDWCAFYEATMGKELLYGRNPKFYPKHFRTLLGFISSNFGCDLSDLNIDQEVNTADLLIFSSKYLELDSETVDWCVFYEATMLEKRYETRITQFYLGRFKLLLGFIYDRYGCDPVLLSLKIKNRPKSLVRAAIDVDHSGQYYISDAHVGSVFIYDTGRILVGELKNLDKPLGVAIDSQGYLLVGNNGRNNIEVYDPDNGDLLATFGEGMVKMPTAITIGPNGDIFVTDSKSHQVWVFEASYVHIRTIGMPGRADGQLKFPTDTAVITRKDTLVQEIFIADQGNRRIQVFDLNGNYLRTIGPSMSLSFYCTNYGWYCPKNVRGTFNRLQALDVDTDGRLHVLDVFEAMVNIIDPISGNLLGSYGAWGDGTGLLRAPLDVLITDLGDALVTDSGNGEMEVFAIP